jgi:hypothetical protein
MLEKRMLLFEKRRTLSVIKRHSDSDILTLNARCIAWSSVFIRADTTALLNLLTAWAICIRFRVNATPQVVIRSHSRSGISPVRLCGQVSV